MAQNIDAHVRYLRRGDVGHEAPHNVIIEIVLSRIGEHLILAYEGKRWEAPRE